MDPRFSPHNTHLDDLARFSELDPQLRRLSQQKYQHRSNLLVTLPRDIPGIYTLSGGRQIGKSTLLKQWMADLLAIGIAPESIAFFSGELIDDHHSLFGVIHTQLASSPKHGLKYLIIDEVTYVHDWDKAIKYAADAGILEQTVLVLTGSDLSLIRDARVRFPGRRGQADITDFHLYPLSFKEFIILKGSVDHIAELIAKPETIADNTIDAIYKEFDQYLIHGGFLAAINDFAVNGKISPGTLRIYSDWIRGDMLKRGKQERYLKEVLTAIIKRYNSQITWNSLARDLSIDHPKTVADYIMLLEYMDAVFIQAAILEDKLIAAPKKAKKIMFCDPFIFHALRAWLEPVADPYSEQILVASRDDPTWVSSLVEACVITHHRRFYPTYYIKAQGEVDIAYVTRKKFWPIEIKWTKQLRPKDIKQVGKYSNGEIWAKIYSQRNTNGVLTYPLPIKLLQLG